MLITSFRYPLVLLICFSFVAFSAAQSFVSLVENKTTSIEDVNVSYSTRFVKSKKGNDIYEVTISLKNKGRDIINILSESDERLSKYPIAEIKFRNAVSGFLNNTDTRIQPKPIYSYLTFTYPNCDYDPDDKKSKKFLEKSERTLVGCGLERGRSINKEIRVKVKSGRTLEVAAAMRY